MLLPGELAQISNKHSTQCSKFVVLMIEICRKRVWLEAIGFSTGQTPNVVTVGNEFGLATTLDLKARTRNTAVFYWGTIFFDLDFFVIDFEESCFGMISWRMMTEHFSICFL